MARTQANDRARTLHNELERQVEALVTGEDWKAMLDVASRFHRYSAGNVMLICCQRPTATRVAGYQRWRELGRQVRKGERGIAILAPCVYRTDNGEEESTSVLRGFRVAHVFDIAQTDGEPVADVSPTLLVGDAPFGLWDRLAAVVAAEGFELSRRQPVGGANGTTDYAAREVVVRSDVEPAQACKTLAHELAHVLMHDGTEYATGCRGRVEVEAESVAYIVGAASGLKTADYSLPYVARWSDGDMARVRATADRVVGAARRIIDALSLEAVA